MAGGGFEVMFCLSTDLLARNLGAQQVVQDELERYKVAAIFLNQPLCSRWPPVLPLTCVSLAADAPRHLTLAINTGAHTFPASSLPSHRIISFARLPPCPLSGSVSPRSFVGLHCDVTYWRLDHLVVCQN